MSVNGTVALVLAAALGIVSSSALAQHDDETEDHRRRDEEYFRRYVQSESESTDRRPTADDESAQADAFLARADELIRDRNYRSETGSLVRIQTDDPRIDLRGVATLLERFRTYFEEFWLGRAELAPYDETSRVLLFYSYYKYNQLLDGDWSRSLVRPKGHYGSLFDAIILHTDSDRPGGLANTIVHESAHQLIDQRLFGRDRRPALWISEGLAQYFGDTYMPRDAGFETAVVGGKEIEVFLGRKGAGESDAKPRIKALRRLLEEAGEREWSPSGRLLVASDPNSFYGRGVEDNYALSWLIVHYLFHGDDGAHAATFVEWITARTPDDAVGDAILAKLGMTEYELDAALLAHTRSIKVR